MITENRMRLVSLSVMLLVVVAMHAQTVADVRRELKRQGVPHAEVVLAQARLESGNFQSRRARADHNILGMKRGARYAKYRRWQDCVADYKRRISSRYKRGESYYAFLRRIGYASDKKYIGKVKDIVRTSKNKKNESKRQKNG